MKKKNTQSFRELNPEDMSCSNSRMDFATDVLVGLSLSPKRLPCKYIYDDRGSQIFQQIMDLPEYYLTSSEEEILQVHKNEILDTIGKSPLRLVEMGAGDGKKSKILLEEMSRLEMDFTYNPIDISYCAVKDLTHDLQEDLPDIQMEGLVTDYFRGLKWLSNLGERINVVLFLGSNIGNFNPQDADVFFSNLWNACNDGDFVLVGFDMKKDISLLINAYNDSLGITAEFNLNLLNRINVELGGHFNLEDFEFYSTYDAVDGAVKSYLISRKDQFVSIDELNREFFFSRFEPIHTESSFKYLVKDVLRYARRNGFEVVRNLYDTKEYFTDSLWRVRKPNGISNRSPLS